ncbi:MAG: RNA-binding protein [Dethiosulfovibrio peptidovorans]|nr:MAG: RNA-binding protein [Dethiosulfovibrio peptidovorans]
MAIRIDLYLKLARLVKRRTVAQEIVTVGAVRINGRKVKPSTVVRSGDTVDIAFPRRLLIVRVLVDDEALLKRKRGAPYALLEDRQVEPETRLWEGE